MITIRNAEFHTLPPDLFDRTLSPVEVEIRAATKDLCACKHISKKLYIGSVLITEDGAVREKPLYACSCCKQLLKDGKPIYGSFKEYMEALAAKHGEVSLTINSAGAELGFHAAHVQLPAIEKPTR